MNKQKTIRDIPGYEGLYQVSAAGEVFSLHRNTTQGRKLTPQRNNSGYHRVSMTRNGKSKYLYVHHLVALAFIGPRPERHDVNHINGDKLDNRASNLEYMTRTENMEHARQLGLHDNRGEKHYGSKLTEDLVRDFRYAYKTCGLRGKDMAEGLGVSARTIDDAIDGLTWVHVTTESVQQSF